MSNPTILHRIMMCNKIKGNYCHYITSLSSLLAVPSTCTLTAQVQHIKVKAVACSTVFVNDGLFDRSDIFDVNHMRARFQGHTNSTSTQQMGEVRLEGFLSGGSLGESPFCHKASQIPRNQHSLVTEFLNHDTVGHVLRQAVSFFVCSVLFFKISSNDSISL